MLRTFSRVVLGFLLACLTAGLVQVLFVMTPGRFIALPAEVFPERVSQALVLALLAATHAAIFASVFALIAAGWGEAMRIRDVGYYLGAGVSIALAGFLIQYSSEIAGQPSILNNYAVIAFLTSGFFAGLVYWLASGRSAGQSRRVWEGTEMADATTPATLPRRRWRDRPRIAIADATLPGTRDGREAMRGQPANKLERESVETTSTLEVGPKADRIEIERRALEAARQAALEPATVPHISSGIRERLAQLDDEDLPNILADIDEAADTSDKSGDRRANDGGRRAAQKEKG